MSLSDRGPLTFPDLLASTQLPLTVVLHALKGVQDFHLVEVVGEHNIIQLTSAGHRTATVIRGSEIREQAEKKLLDN